MEIRKLHGHESAKAQVIYENARNMKLISYSTVVLNMVHGKLFITGLYSATTRRHISWFMREYTCYSYYAIKECLDLGTKVALDLVTGDYIVYE